MENKIHGNKQNYIKFGCLNLNFDKLYYKNVLSVRNNNMHHFSGFYDHQVSDLFVDIVKNIIDNKYPTIKDFESLKNDEYDLLNMLIYTSKLHREIKISKEKTITNLKTKLELIENEIKAGNDNIELPQQLQRTLNKLANMNVISKEQARRHLKQFKN
jgi:ribosomal protein S20